MMNNKKSKMVMHAINLIAEL